MGLPSMPSSTTTVTAERSDARQAALDHLWMHNRSWAATAEEDGPSVIVEGQGIRVIDSEGRDWIDVNGGYMCVNVGYGRRELAEAMREQMSQLVYFPQGSTTQPLVNLAAKLADITPGNLQRSWPADRRLRGERDCHQDRQGIPQAKGRVWPIQDHQQKGLVPRRSRPDDVDRQPSLVARTTNPPSRVWSMPRSLTTTIATCRTRPSTRLLYVPHRPLRT